MPSILEAKVQEVVDDLKVPLGKQVALDPMIWKTIMDIVLALLKAWQDCQANEPTTLTFADAARDPDIQARWHLRRSVRLGIRDDEFHAFAGRHIVQSLRKVGKTLVSSEGTMMVEEAVAMNLAA